MCLPSFFFFSLSGGQQREIIVSKSDPKVLIKDYSPLKDYTVSVTAVSGRDQSRPLNGRYKGVLVYFTFCFMSKVRSLLLYSVVSYFLISCPFLVCYFLTFTHYIRDHSVLIHIIWQHTEDIKTMKYDIFIYISYPLNARDTVPMLCWYRANISIQLLQWTILWQELLK